MYAAAACIVVGFLHVPRTDYPCEDLDVEISAAPRQFLFVIGV